MTCNITAMSGESGTGGVDRTRPEDAVPLATGAIWAVVPVKRLAAAKQRLAEALGEAREEFAYLLACRTLDVLQSTDMFTGVIVVTPDPRIAAAARARGAAVVDDDNSSLNQACVLGLGSAARYGATLAVLLPCDLATLTAEGLERLVHSYLRLRRTERAAIGLVRCKEGTGTNLVLVDPASAFEPSFGPDSFSRHLRDSGPSAFELREPTVSFDIDTPEELEVLRATINENCEDGPIASLLRRSALAATQALTVSSSAQLAPRAAELRDLGHGTLITYSRKVFLPLTQLCRDSCHYCTFAKAPRRLKSPYMPIEEAVSVAAEGARLGCREALFTLGERPELRYRAAREWLTAHGFDSTLHYLAHAAVFARGTCGKTSFATRSRHSSASASGNPGGHRLRLIQSGLSPAFLRPSMSL